MKTTTTLHEIIQSELINSGNSEFFNENQLTFFDKDYSFVQKIMRYDEDIQKICDDMFFGNISLNTKESDLKFKREFINRFYNREIGLQTVEAFKSQVIYVFLTHFDYINYLYDELDDFIKMRNDSDTKDTGNKVADNRYLSSELPQNQINLNVENTVLDYGDLNTISRDKEDTIGNTKTQTKQYDLDNLLNSKNLLMEVFDEFDRKCFLQTW